MHGPFVPNDSRNDTGPTLPPAQFIDTSNFGIVPFRVINPGAAPDSAPAFEPPHGEGRAEQASNQPAPVEAAEPLVPLRATINALAHEARWRGPPRDLPLSERMAGHTIVETLNAAIADLEIRLAQNPPPAHRAIRLTPVPTGVLLALGDLREPLRQADRALRWLEGRERWRRQLAAWELRA